MRRPDVPGRMPEMGSVGTVAITSLVWPAEALLAEPPRIVSDASRERATVRERKEGRANAAVGGRGESVDRITRNAVLSFMVDFVL